jgi:hypothetical protein
MKKRLRNTDTGARTKRRSTHLTQVPRREDHEWDKSNLKKNAGNLRTTERH